MLDRVKTVRVLPWGTGAMVARGACEPRGRFEFRWAGGEGAAGERVNESRNF